MWLLRTARRRCADLAGEIRGDKKILRPSRLFTQTELDATADFLNRHYSGWTLEAIRADFCRSWLPSGSAMRAWRRAR